MRRATRSYGASATGLFVAGVAAAALAISVLTASPAFAAKTSAQLKLSPGHGPAGTQFSATLQISGGPGGQCPGGVVAFTFDGQPVSQAGVDPTMCSASVSLQIPPGTPAGAHKVKGTLTGGSSTASSGSTFTVDQGGPSNPQSSVTLPTAPTSTPSTTPPPTTPSWSNTITPTVPWTAPAFAPQKPTASSAICDITGDHAKDAASGFMLVEAYSAGQRIQPVIPSGVAPQPSFISQPLSSRLAIASAGPAAMAPPQLGSKPYQSLEIIEPYDKDVSPKLQLAAAAGEPLGCVKVELAGAPGSGYGYLVYALKGALVVSSQELDPPTPAPLTTPPAKGAKPTTPAAPAKPRFVRVVLGYSSLTWEYQEAGDATSPIHRGNGSVVPPAPAGTLSYGNLVFAFGGLIAAAVALMFAYHSRRRELVRRERRRASHA